MTTETLQQQVPWRPVRFLGFLVRRAVKHPTVPEEMAQDDRARRAFVLEMMEAHPDAFQHELDVQAMMHCYPARF
jgi:hypothetical protein